MLFEPTGKVHNIPNRNIGGCFLMKRDFFQQIGGFNENFFLWWEDTELRDRVLDNNKMIGFADGIVVAHSGAHSTNPPEPSRRAYLTRVWLSSHTFYLLERKGMLTALVWCISMLSYNLVHIFTGKVKCHLVPTTASRQPLSSAYTFLPTATAFGSLSKRIPFNQTPNIHLPRVKLTITCRSCNDSQ